MADDEEEKAFAEEEKPPPIAPVQYEYMDHTADVQLHAWGRTLGEALQQLVISLYGYMTTDISHVQPLYTMDFQASGHDLQSLVYNLLDTCLYSFCAEPLFIGCSASVLQLNRPKERTDGGKALASGSDEFSVKMRVWGESFDREKHPAGTEVKAITYSNMQIMEKHEKEEAGGGGGDVKREERTDIFVIIDI